MFRLLVCSLLVGCGHTPMSYTFMLGDVEITEHIDHPGAPAECGDRTSWDGCYMRISGKHHIWRSSAASAQTVAHERSHALGMRHTEWRDVFGGKCATVLAPGGRYLVGQTICVDRSGERVLGP